MAERGVSEQPQQISRLVSIRLGQKNSSKAWKQVHQEVFSHDYSNREQQTPA
jgi:hypothetical protein